MVANLARSAATILEAAGLAAASVGVGLLWGVGAGLVAAGAGTLTLGVALDVSQARGGAS